MSLSRFAAPLLAVFALAPRAFAEPPAERGASFGPAPARAISRSVSASRDAPVFEYAYGPRAQASLGGELGLFTYRGSASTFRLGLSALVALENGDAKRAWPPDEFHRTIVGATLSVSAERLAKRVFGARAALELSLFIGFERDGQSGSYAPPDPPRSWYIALGESGLALTPALALRAPLSRRVDVTMELHDRLTVAGLVASVGATSASDAVAGFVGEGLLQAPGAELGLRYRAFTRASPILSVAGEQLIPLEPARTGFRVRTLLGLALGGLAGELVPFVSVDAGNGHGLLINRREARLSFGVRYAIF